MHHERDCPQTVAVVLAGGRGSRLKQLTDWRAKPAVPFGGNLRIIDFPLSNCINSGIRRIGVLTQYKAQSLIRHIQRGWGFLESNLGEFIEVIPAQQRGQEGWYAGTANAVYQNLDLLPYDDTKFVVILAGDHIYKMDYGRMLADHVAHRAEVTVACTEVPLAAAPNFGVLALGADSRLTAFQEKPAAPTPLPGHPDQALASMGIYIFGAEVLFEELERDARDPASSHDFGKDLLPYLVTRRAVHAHRFRESCVNMVGNVPYWRDVGTIDAYWEANIDLTRVVPELNLYDDSWPIWTRQRQMPPAKFVFDNPRLGAAIDSLVASGCIVSGATIRRSLLSTGVRVQEGSVVEDSVILPHVTIGKGVTLRHAIVEKFCVLPDGFSAGVDRQTDAGRFAVSDRGIVIVTPEMLGQHVHRGPLRTH
jgi:glucose-1-phosphate adenylyltransferase